MLGLRQMGLGGWAPGEAMAFEHKLAAWERQGGYQDWDNALRYIGFQEGMQDVVWRGGGREGTRIMRSSNGVGAVGGGVRGGTCVRWVLMVGPLGRPWLSDSSWLHGSAREATRTGTMHPGDE